MVSIVVGGDYIIQAFYPLLFQISDNCRRSRTVAAVIEKKMAVAFSQDGKPLSHIDHVKTQDIICRSITGGPAVRFICRRFPQMGVWF